HLEAGRNIRAALDARGSADEHMEEYLHHFNAAADLITDARERRTLAALNITLGKRLKSNAAYQAAESSFAMAVAFLPPEPFEAHYAMAVDLFTEYGESLFLNLKYEEGVKQFETVIAHSKSPLDSAKVYARQINHHASHHHLEKAMKMALHALEALGVKLPERWLKIRAAAELLKVKRLLKNKKAEDVLDFPVTEDPLVLAQMDVLSAAALPAYLGYPEFFPILISRAMRISIVRGNCVLSPQFLMGYAMILCHFGDVNTGFSYGKTALALMEKLEAKQLFTKLSFLFGYSIQHWKAPMRDSAAFFETAIANGLKTGDYEFASYAANIIMLFDFYSGKSIESLLNQYPGQHKILAGFSKDLTIFLAKYWNQLLVAMNDPTGDGVSVSGDIIDENRLIPLMEERKALSSLGVCMIGKMQLAYLAGNYEIAMSVRARAIELLKALTASIFIPVCHFFAALTCIAYYRKHTGDASLLREAKRSMKKLKKWGADAPENYLYKAQLVEAELLSVKGKQPKALKLYEAAIINAQKAGNNLDLGIACECMGRYLERIGLETMSKEYIRRSITVFHDWGALNKSNRLRGEFGVALDRDGAPRDGDGSRDSPGVVNIELDLAALAGTIESLTSDLQFDSLLETLLTAVMHRSGATRAVYIHMDRGRPRVGAEKRASGHVRIVDGTDARPASFGLPVSLLEKCCSGAREHILENIALAPPPRGGERRESRL
ncbi:MAG: hypothetical protein GY859_17000, partial [Desulfobacterales bacterium]|nr:hypothetical protein [Desulfobacterales bacterium]